MGRRVQAERPLTLRLETAFNFRTVSKLGIKAIEGSGGMFLLLPASRLQSDSLGFLKQQGMNDTERLTESKRN